MWKSETGNTTTGQRCKLENRIIQPRFRMTVAIRRITRAAVEPTASECDLDQSVWLNSGRVLITATQTLERVFARSLLAKTCPPLRSVRQFHSNVTAPCPGALHGPALARTYLYYTSEERVWATPLEIEFT